MPELRPRGGRRLEVLVRTVLEKCLARWRQKTKEPALWFWVFVALVDFIAAGAGDAVGPPTWEGLYAARLSCLVLVTCLDGFLLSYQPCVPLYGSPTVTMALIVGLGERALVPHRSNLNAGKERARGI